MKASIHFRVSRQMLCLIISFLTCFPNVSWASLSKKVSSVSLEMITPFLNNSLILPKKCLDEAPTIEAVDDQHLLIIPCFRFFAKVCDPRLGDRYGIYRQGKKFVDPRTCAYLGHEARLLGVGRIVQVGCLNYFSTFVLEYALEEIKMSDKLLPYVECPKPDCIRFRSPDSSNCGFIIDVLEGLIQIGEYNIIVITGGRDEGRQFGDLLGIYQTKQEYSPRVKYIKIFKGRSCRSPKSYQSIPQKAGEVMVFRVFDKVSLGLVTYSTRPIYLQDQVKKP